MIPLGDVMRAASVGQVIQSRHPGYKPGEPSETLRQAAREPGGGDVAVNGNRRAARAAAWTLAKRINPLANARLAAKPHFLSLEADGS